MDGTIKLQDIDDFISTWGENSLEFEKLYKEGIADSVLNTALGLRQAGFPPLVIENIASHASDTSGFSLYQLMNMITPVVEGRPVPGVIGAGQTEYDEEDYIDI